MFLAAWWISLRLEIGEEATKVGKVRAFAGGHTLHGNAIATYATAHRRPQTNEVSIVRFRVFHAAPTLQSTLSGMPQLV